jgi:hypothetical protein
MEPLCVTDLEYELYDLEIRQTLFAANCHFWVKPKANPFEFCAEILIFLKKPVKTFIWTITCN